MAFNRKLATKVRILEVHNGERAWKTAASPEIYLPSQQVSRGEQTERWWFHTLGTRTTGSNHPNCQLHLFPHLLLTTYVFCATLSPLIRRTRVFGERR